MLSVRIVFISITTIVLATCHELLTFTGSAEKTKANILLEDELGKIRTCDHFYHSCAEYFESRHFINQGGRYGSLVSSELNYMTVSPSKGIAPFAVGVAGIIYRRRTTTQNPLLSSRFG